MQQTSTTPEAGKKRKLPGFMASKPAKSPALQVTHTSTASPARPTSADIKHVTKGAANTKSKRLKQSTLPPAASTSTRPEQQASATRLRTIELVLDLPDLALVQGCRDTLQKADSVVHQMPMSLSQQSQQMQAHTPSQEPQPLALSAMPPVAPAEAASASATAASSDPAATMAPRSADVINVRRSDPDDNWTAEQTEATELHAGITAEQALLQLHTLEADSQAAKIPCSENPVSTQSMLLDAMLQDGLDAKDGHALIAQRMTKPTEDEEAPQPPAAAMLQPPAQQAKPSASRIDSLLDAMLA